MNSKTIKDLSLITAFVLISTFLIWLPHLLATPNFWGLNFQNGINTIYRNFDGLEYIVIAKSFYNPDLIAAIPQPMPANYFAAHFPGYPILIALVAPFLGYLKSMLFISILFTIFSAIAFYFLVKDFKLTSNPLLLSLIFLILPARWLIVRSVGSPEPMFIFFIILSLYFLLKSMSREPLTINFVWLSALFASLAQLTRPPAILFFIALGLFFLWKIWVESKPQGLSKAFTTHLRFFPFLLVPITLLGIFYWYGLIYGDFFAFFHSGDNIHLTFPPFQIFNQSQYWVGTIWLEDIIYIFALGLLGSLLLWKRKLYPMAFFVLTYITASMFVAHRDLSRYVLPIAPFVIIAFEKVLVSKEFKIVLTILLIAIYLYSQNYILQNTAPVADLSYYN